MDLDNRLRFWFGLFVVSGCFWLVIWGNVFASIPPADDGCPEHYALQRVCTGPITAYVVKGDLNENCRLDAGDLWMALQYVLHHSGCYWEWMDMDRNGVSDVGDVLLIQNEVMG